jgi:FtsZ-binding cell division protein ZapB
VIDQSYNNVWNIYPLNQPKIFSHEEALELLPLLQMISSKTKRKINALNSQLSFQKSETEKAKSLQFQINRELQMWSDKVRRLGTLPLSLGKVKIPSEDGSFLWEYPENKLYLN